MSLRVYNRKRNFRQTPEPTGKKGHASGPLRFVVQMHAATRLHFDFRLEFDGVFKSWAVPKGPSLNPLDQRLAVFVEDHPIAYGSFEGIIPKGNYGAGTVMIWDEGIYTERGSVGRKDSEKAMKKNFEKGHLTFVLDGQKLKGEFALILLKKDSSQKSWLLVKKRDQYSTYKRSEIPSNDSVKSGRSIEQIKAQSEAAGDVWLPGHRTTRVNAAHPIRPKPNGAAAPKSPRTKMAPMPRKIKPMLATVSRAAAPMNWPREPAINGLRAIAEVDGKHVTLYSRAGLSFNNKFSGVVQALKNLNAAAVFDGEIVGQKYYIYDVLYWRDRDLRQRALEERKKILENAFTGDKTLIKVASASAKPGAAKVVAKNPRSFYKSGTSGDWLIVDETKTAPETHDDEAHLSHPDKIFFPKDRITKGDLFTYYESVAEYILPYLKDRPESMNRQPNGIEKPGFFQKDLTGHRPRWIKTERIFSESADKSIDYLLCQDKRSLLYMINLGCIEINPWLSRIGSLEKPDFLVIDLDPDDNPFDHVIKIAHEIHELLDEVGAANFCKTSGATGIHIGVPLGAKYSYDKAREFAESVCRVIAKRNPALTSVDRNPQRRRKKIYLDFLQNRRGQTLAAPFCVRPKPGAPVSMPLTWSELKKGVKPEDFNMHNALVRIKKFDHWRNVLGPSVNLSTCLKMLQRKYPSL